MTPVKGRGRKKTKILGVEPRAREEKRKGEKFAKLGRLSGSRG